MGRYSVEEAFIYRAWYFSIDEDPYIHDMNNKLSRLHKSITNSSRLSKLRLLSLKFENGALIAGLRIMPGSGCHHSLERRFAEQAVFIYETL
ncbi:hypothetical protein BDV29DRAFT_180211 [Aspergillus leporis]|uniref:FHA domain-containing protein n=1 Tax=Aspergillus leporis TaxID=41062 RepID=A0A5N5WQF4_9EURO|nr:hypothetical protein BDV29DRAFT_180211 [Aspergillus leporis]